MSYRNVTPNTATSSQDRLTEIRARLDDWNRQKEVGTEGWWDGVRHYEPLMCADIAWLLAKVEALREPCGCCDCQRMRGEEVIGCECGRCKRYRSGGS